MNIISHRGLWSERRECNSMSAICRSFERGFGVETDLRDLNGEVVISHDAPKAKDQLLTLDGLLKAYKDAGHAGLPLALNVKSDGLQQLITECITRHKVENYRLFDMSLPDQKATCDGGLSFLTRLSDIEHEPLMLKQAKGIWVDAFYSDWYGLGLVNSYLQIGKEVWMVSPELHGRPCVGLWEKLRGSDLAESECIFLCTDYPEKAKEYFSGKN